MPTEKKCVNNFTYIFFVAKKNVRKCKPFTLLDMSSHFGLNKLNVHLRTNQIGLNNVSTNR